MKLSAQRTSAEEAFGILRAASQNRNVKLRDVAAGIVTRVSGAPPRSAPFCDRPAGT